MTVEFFLLDPRPASLSAEQEKLRTLRREGYFVIGVEITIPDLAAGVDINIDPQHSGVKYWRSPSSNIPTQGDVSAIALISREGFDILRPTFPREWEDQKVAFATVRPDLDAFGGIALLWWELQAPYSVQQHSSNAMRSRIQAIHNSDTFSRGEWQPRELGTGEDSYLAAIARCVSDFKVPMRDRIEHVQRWLETGEEPAGYRAAYERESGEILSAIASGETSVEASGDYGYPAQGRVCVVQSRLRAATSVGYTQAPIVMAVNPAFSMGGAPPTRKFTICQYRAGYVDLPAVRDELASLEAGWGGSPTIIGSPQGVDSNLPLETVVAIVAKHLL